MHRTARRTIKKDPRRKHNARGLLNARACWCSRHASLSIPCDPSTRIIHDFTSTAKTRRANPRMPLTCKPLLASKMYDRCWEASNCGERHNSTTQVFLHAAPTQARTGYTVDTYYFPARPLVAPAFTCISCKPCQKGEDKLATVWFIDGIPGHKKKTLSAHISRSRARSDTSVYHRPNLSLVHSIFCNFAASDERAE